MNEQKYSKSKINEQFITPKKIQRDISAQFCRNDKIKTQFINEEKSYS